jgi:hypothetical protein
VRTSERRELMYWAVVSVLVDEGVRRIESLNAGHEILIGYNGKDEDCSVVSNLNLNLGGG